jgi:hypothetical protein
MNELCVCFWNVCNLFEVGVVARGPQSNGELEAKIGNTAAILNRMSEGECPDLLGLAEIGSKRIFDILSDRLNGEYLRLWEPPGKEDQTGLGILARTSIFSGLERMAVQRPMTFARPRVLLASAAMASTEEKLLVAVNRWKSRMFGQGPLPQIDREESARWLGEELANSERETCAIVMGDFNAEPYEREFGEVQLRALRTFSCGSGALWPGATPAYLYNSAWRFLPEPLYWEDWKSSGGILPRPRTSHASSPPVIYDQLLVSGRALMHGPIELIEKSVRYYCDDDTAFRNRLGNLLPKRWAYEESGNWQGASDHFPLLATFKIRE